MWTAQREVSVKCLNFWKRHKKQENPNSLLERNQTFALLSLAYVMSIEVVVEFHRKNSLKSYHHKKFIHQELEISYLSYFRNTEPVHYKQEKSRNPQRIDHYESKRIPKRRSSSTKDLAPVYIKLIFPETMAIWDFPNLIGMLTCAWRTVPPMCAS